MDYQAPLSMEIFEARILEWIAISFSNVYYIAYVHIVCIVYT